MNNNYTLFNRQSLQNYFSIDEDLEDAVDFLKSPASFRSFDLGLKELLRKKGYTGSEENGEMADYLYAKLKALPSDIERETVYAWFAGKHRPKIEAGSRRRIYEICFALQLDYEETLWFFHHVYYDRAFNCHTVDEAVFYYALLHGNTWREALDVINAVENANDEWLAGKGTDDGEPPFYTQYVQCKISDFSSTWELEEFLIANRDSFHSWNSTALNVINELMHELTGDEDAKLKIDNLKRTLSRRISSGNAVKDLPLISKKDYDSFGLLIKEILFDAQNSADSPAEYLLETIGGKNIRANTFVLDRLLCTVSGMPKNIDIPYVVRNNFPGKKVMSDVLDATKISTSKSYDSIRKMIVLLDFYAFWACIKVGISDVSDIDKSTLYEIYQEEANSRLKLCGYENLYAGNPYDWIFLCASHSEDPLAFFRAYIADLLPE